MAVSVELPNLGREMSGGLVAEWYLPDGTPVAQGEAVCRVECSFIAYEVEAEQAGLLRIRRPAGSIERPGVVLGVILEPGEAMPPDQPAPRNGPIAEEIDEAPVAPAEPEPTVERPEEPRFDEEDGVEEDESEEDGEAETEPAQQPVVVPFPRRFAQMAAPAWDVAPGDAVEFTTSLFGSQPDEVTEGLPEAGGTIPGLPLWEPEDARAGAAAYPASAEERFQRIADEAEASAQVLTIAVEIDMSEAAKMTAVCEREWRKHGVVPRIEDAAFRAIATALEGTVEAGGAGGMLIAEAATDISCAVSDPAARTLREAAVVRNTGGDAPFEQANWVLASLASLGVSAATPRLDGGRSAAFALGATRRDGLASLTMAYDSGKWSEGSAGRLLARVRDLLEAPYGMLV